jgi:dye decolorizing peroxidase
MTMSKNTAVSRRGLFGLAATASVIGGCARRAEGSPAAERALSFGESVAVYGASQAGIERPAVPQGHLELGVFDLDDGVEPGAALARVGEAVVEVAVSGRSARLAGIAPGDVTVTIGVGPRLIAGVDPALPGAAALPVFAREEIAANDRGGDVMVQVCGSDPLVVTLASSAMADAVRAAGGVARWSQRGFRRYGDDRYALNLLGFRDGIVQPDPATSENEVWMAGPARVAGGTIAVVRRLRIDLAGFLGTDVAAQEAAVGRRRADGCPLSGGGVLAPLDLGAKSADGRYLIPADAHARRAHPGATGVGVMLRRGYNYDNGVGDQGLLFVSFHRELRTFTETQYRLDEKDALMDRVTATASASFLVLPGFSERTPLGAALYA